MRSAQSIGNYSANIQDSRSLGSGELLLKSEMSLGSDELLLKSEMSLGSDELLTIPQSPFLLMISRMSRQTVAILLIQPLGWSAFMLQFP